VVGWYLHKLPPSDGPRIPRTLTSASFGSAMGSVAPSESVSVPAFVDLAQGNDQWIYWAEEASWRRTVHVALRLGESEMPSGFFEEETQAVLTQHLTLFPPPSAPNKLRARYALPLRERIRYLITHLGGFSEHGTPRPLQPVSGSSSPLYGLTHGSRLRPNLRSLQGRYGTWELEARTLLASYEECVCGISEFPKAIRGEREERRYERVKECFEWLGMVNWETEKEEEEEEWVPEIERWRWGWASVEVGLR